MENIESYKHVQSIAKETMQYLSSVIIPGITEKGIKDAAEKFMLSHGVESFWYYDIGAFVFVGSRTVLSMSGKNYIPSETEVQRNDIVTVDLSPCIGTFWGDYARTFTLGDSRFEQGILFQKHLHDFLSRTASPQMSFDAIYQKVHEEIENAEFKNVDFNMNLGHTIEDSKEKRRYIEKGNPLLLKDAGLFTFEPHIQKVDENYGFKMEDIYYFKNKKLCML